MKHCIYILFFLVPFRLFSQVSFTHINGLAPSLDEMASVWDATWVDYNNDFWLDLFVVSKYHYHYPNSLYRNNQDGTFTRVGTIGYFAESETWNSCAWADYNQDGFLDVFMSNYTNESGLYTNNGDGTFSRDLSKLPLGHTSRHGSDWVDYEGDGDPDLLSVRERKIYVNEGDGAFRPISLELNKGVFDGQWVDFDNDNDFDIFFSADGNDYSNNHNEIFINNGDGTFSRKQSGIEVSLPGESIQSTWADFDNDLDLDFFVSNYDGTPNHFFINNGDGSFTKSSSNVFDVGGSMCYHSTWGDVDNDGDQDFFVACLGKDDLFYINNGDGTFKRDRTFHNLYGGDQSSKAAALGDYDNDGFLDLFVEGSSYNLIYKNDGNDNNWIKFHLRGGTLVGTRVYIKSEGKWQMRVIGGDNHLISAVHFGLSQAVAVDSVIVKWTTGLEQVLTNVSNNQALIINKPATTVSKKNSAPVVLYPNPASNWLTIKFSSQWIGETVNGKIYDLNGRFVSSFETEAIVSEAPITIPLKDLPSGIYVLQISGQQYFFNHKLIIIKQ
jgi:hypothetical protein